VFQELSCCLRRGFFDLRQQSLIILWLVAFLRGRCCQELFSEVVSIEEVRFGTKVAYFKSPFRISLRQPDSPLLSESPVFFLAQNGDNLCSGLMDIFVGPLSVNHPVTDGVSFACPESEE
jgi:hypothetical protein